MADKSKLLYYRNYQIFLSLVWEHPHHKNDNEKAKKKKKNFDHLSPFLYIRWLTFLNTLVVFDGLFPFTSEMSPWCGQESDVPHLLRLLRCGQSVIVHPLTVWFLLLQWTATVGFFFLCVFCALSVQVRAFLYTLIGHWMRYIAPPGESNTAPNVPGFLFVAIPPLHSLSFLLSGPWRVLIVGERCLNVLLLFLQVSFCFFSESGSCETGWSEVHSR